MGHGGTSGLFRRPGAGLSGDDKLRTLFATCPSCEGSGRRPRDAVMRRIALISLIYRNEDVNMKVTEKP